MLLTKLTVAFLVAAVAVVAAGAAAVICRAQAVPVSPAPPVLSAPADGPADPAKPGDGEKPAGGLTARIVAPPAVAADDPELKGELVVTNEGGAPARVCTLTPGNDGLGGAFGQHFRPDWWKSDRPPLETSARQVVTLEPGKSASFPFTINRVHYKDRDSFTITGFYSVEDKEFAEKLALWAGKAEARPVEVRVGKGSAWGEADDGVQARLRPSKTAWDAGETLEFVLDLRNQGEKDHGQCRVPNFCEIEWDGQWYRYGGPDELDCKAFVLNSGKQIDDWVKTSLEIPWVRKAPDGKEERLKASAGKHTVRVAFVFDGGPRPVSQAAEIEVGKQSAWGDPAGGVQARLRTPKAIWEAGEAPTFILDLRALNLGAERKTNADALKVKCDLEIEVDGVWYWNPNEPDRRVRDMLGSYVLDTVGKTTDWVSVDADKNWELKTPDAAGGKPGRFPLPAGKHTIRISYETTVGSKVFRPESGPVEIEVLAEEEAWGQSVDGVQARLRPSKVAWDQGENPEFTLDLRNRGKNTHALCRSPAYCRIEVDGKPYMQAVAKVVEYTTTPLNPGDEVSGWLTFQPNSYFPQMPGGFPGTPNDDEERLTTKVGKHTMRAYIGFDVGDPPGVVPSQPVEFEIGKQSDWGKDDGGIQARVRTPKAVLVPMEAPTFRVDLQNVGEKTPHSLHIPFDCEIEVDGTWYYYNGPVDVTSQDTKLEPGKEYDNWVKVTPDGIWQEKAPKGRKPRMLLPLSLGKHKIRVAYPISSEKPPLRPVSEPMEIEVREK